MAYVTRKEGGKAGRILQGIGQGLQGVAEAGMSIEKMRQQREEIEMRKEEMKMRKEQTAMKTQLFATEWTYGQIDMLSGLDDSTWKDIKADQEYWNKFNKIAAKGTVPGDKKRLTTNLRAAKQALPDAFSELDSVFNNIVASPALTSEQFSTNMERATKLVQEVSGKLLPEGRAAIQSRLDKIREVGQQKLTDASSGENQKYITTRGMPLGDQWDPDKYVSTGQVGPNGSRVVRRINDLVGARDFNELTEKEKESIQKRVKLSANQVKEIGKAREIKQGVNTVISLLESKPELRKKLGTREAVWAEFANAPLVKKITSVVGWNAQDTVDEVFTTTFRNLEQTFQKYRIDVTGVQAGLKELEQLRKLVPSIIDNPKTFDLGMDLMKRVADIQLATDVATQLKKFAGENPIVIDQALKQFGNLDATVENMAAYILENKSLPQDDIKQMVERVNNQVEGAQIKTEGIVTPNGVRESSGGDAKIDLNSIREKAKSKLKGN